MLRNLSCAVALAVAGGPAFAQEAEGSKLRRSSAQTAQPARAAHRTRQPRHMVIPKAPRRASSTAYLRDRRVRAFRRRGGTGTALVNLGESELVSEATSIKLARPWSPPSRRRTVEGEEAFFQTLALGAGSRERRPFLSGIATKRDPHTPGLQTRPRLQGVPRRPAERRWRPAALGGANGLFVELGAELGRGRVFPGTDRNRNGANAGSLFGHIGGDVGASIAWRAGLSYLRTSPQDRAFTGLDTLGGEVTQSFTGRSRMWIADFVLKWAPNGNPSVTNFKLQGEYFRRRESGMLTFDDSAQDAPQFGAALTDSYSSRQSGWYGQAVYQFVPRWRVGYRYDRLDHGTVENGIIARRLGPTAADFPLLMADHNPTRNTAMLDWSPSEFSRWRLQYASDKSRVGLTDNQILLQYILSLGAHGAHKF